MPFGRVALVKLEQLTKQQYPILVMLLGRVMFVKLEQLVKQ
jgi:hypothetical protein